MSGAAAHRCSLLAALASPLTAHRSRSRRLPRARPMLTSTPTEISVITSPERPYDMKGRLRPVVGMRPRLTARVQQPASATVAVMPAARYWPKGSGAVLAIRKPSQQKMANSDAR